MDKEQLITKLADFIIDSYFNEIKKGDHSTSSLDEIIQPIGSKVGEN